jgi:hypothetical protein
MGKFINWDILLPIILDPCLLIPFYLKNFNKQYTILNFSILLFQNLLNIKEEINLKIFL